MFKLTQLLHKGRQVKELKEIQKEKEEIRKRLDEYDLCPKCPEGIKKYEYSNITMRDFSDHITLWFYGTLSYKDFEIFFQRNYNNNSKDYFKELGNYFLNLSENFETRKPLENRLEKLNKREQKLKDKLGIK